MPTVLTLVILLRASWVSAQITTGDSVRTVDYVYRPRHASGPGGGGPFSGVVPGMALMASSVALLWWNEGETARRETLLRTAGQHVIDAIDGSQPPDAHNDGKLVHVTSPFVHGGGVRDPIFGNMHRAGAARLRRLTEAFLWEEDKHVEETRISDSQVKRVTSYSYRSSWTDRPRDSSRFQGSRAHHNPTTRLQPGTVVADVTDATLPNGVHLDPALIAQLDRWQPVPLTAAPSELAPTGAAGEGQLASGAAQLSDIDGGTLAPVDGNGGNALYFAAPSAPTVAERASSSSSGDDGLERAVSGVGGLDRKAAEAIEMPEAVGRHLGSIRGRLLPSIPVLSLPPTPQIGDARIRWWEVKLPEDGVRCLGRCSDLNPCSDL